MVETFHRGMDMHPARILLQPAAILAISAFGPGLMAGEGVANILRNASDQDWQLQLRGTGQGTVRVITLLANGTSQTATYATGADHEIAIPAGSRVTFRFTDNAEGNNRAGILLETGTDPQDSNDFHLGNGGIRVLGLGPITLSGDFRTVNINNSSTMGTIGSFLGCSIL